MSASAKRSLIIDYFLVGLAVVVLVIAAWTWIVVFPVAQQIVFLAITFAVVAALGLLVSAVFLLVLRLRIRVAQLESYVNRPANSSVATTRPTVQVVTLSNVERRILNRLEEGEGSMTQEDLRRTTGLSKSTLSVALGNLERKSLIKRQEHGRTKLVFLIREIRH